MSFLFPEGLLLEASSQLSRILTGRLLTKEQIESITGHAVGKYFADFFPTLEEQKAASDRIVDAEFHIRQATEIVGFLQSELKEKSESLRVIIADVEEKKRLADHYAILAKTDATQFAALRQELEQTVRNELLERDRKGRRLRQFVSFSFWVITLIVGAAAGAYFWTAMAWIGIHPPTIH